MINYKTTENLQKISFIVEKKGLFDEIQSEKMHFEEIVNQTHDLFVNGHFGDFFQKIDIISDELSKGTQEMMFILEKNMILEDMFRLIEQNENYPIDIILRFFSNAIFVADNNYCDEKNLRIIQ